MKATIKRVIERLIYWLGYKEKETNKYTHYASKEYFSIDAGDNNYTYFGYMCNMNPAQWCALFVTIVMYEACGGDREEAKKALYGVWPYAACNQVWDAAPLTAKRRAGTGVKPIRGDIILFSKDGICREHTGYVENADDTYVYTIEGNSGNMVRRRQYRLDSDYLYGYITPQYAEEEENETPTPKYGKYCYPNVPELSKGNAGYAVKVMQWILIDCGYKIDDDGEFGPITKDALTSFQAENGLDADGVCGMRTWSKMFEL